MQSPDPLRRLFTFLAFPNKFDLGFDTRIGRINHSNFERCFLTRGTGDLKLRVLCDNVCAAAEPRYLERIYRAEQIRLHITEDCWVEDCGGAERTKVRAAISHNTPCEYFVNVRGYRKVENELMKYSIGST